MSSVKVKFHDNHPGVDDMYQDVLHGFALNPRSIPPKYFYNQQGSRLFDQITRTNDYYPTRTEVSIFQQYKQDIVNLLPEHCVLIEPGGGSYSKVMNFIELLRPNVYVPIDISRDYLQASVHELSKLLPWLNIHAVCDDFTKQLNIPGELSTQSRVVFFPGSSIGNFDPDGVVLYLKNVAELLQNKGQLLIGVDLKKDKTVLEKAYDDSQGITAKFNLNLLERINNELQANFDLQCWQHRAIYNSLLGRIEMHLESMCEQVINIKDDEFYFALGETIHTENSYKYSVQEFVALATQAGLESQHTWIDAQNLFSVHLFRVQ